ncbi:hypothetical protein BJ085DRAFT_21171, partial [Dimargaris cristalligena]
PEHQTAEFVWWIGHVIVVIFASLYFIRLFLTFTSVPSLYYRAYLGALLSYIVVIYKSHGKPQFNTEFLQRIGGDENVQYFFLALTWYLMAPLFVTLPPFLIFSSLHTANYMIHNLLPTLFPQITAELAAQSSTASGSRRSGNGSKDAGAQARDLAKLTFPARMASILQTSYKNLNTPALNAAGLWEVAVVMPGLVLAAITFQGSFIAPFFYAHFLRMRYIFSSKTQQAFSFVRAKLDQFFCPPSAHPSIPPVVTSTYVKMRDWTINFGNKATQQRQSQQAAR